MTLAIQRQPRFTKALVVIGSVAATAGLVVGMAKAGNPDQTGGPVAVRTVHVAPRQGFESIQNDYLVPAAILSRQAAIDAELRLQDGYLPPTPTVASRQAWLMIQDGYLPPAELSTTGRFGPR